MESIHDVQFAKILTPISMKWCKCFMIIFSCYSSVSLINNQQSNIIMIWHAELKNWVRRSFKIKMTYSNTIVVVQRIRLGYQFICLLLLHALHYNFVFNIISFSIHMCFDLRRTLLLICVYSLIAFFGWAKDGQRKHSFPVIGIPLWFFCLLDDVDFTGWNCHWFQTICRIEAILLDWIEL